MCLTEFEKRDVPRQYHSRAKIQSCDLDMG